MLSAAVSALRQECTTRYIIGLEEACGLPWGSVAQRSDLVSRLVSCHPGWLPPSPYLRAGLGLTAFRPGARRGPCRADLLWGYECPLKEQAIEADHHFPVALGGPAVGTNQVWLCRLHNQWKGADLLPFRWEDGEPEWLQVQQEQLHRLVSTEARLDV